MFYFKLYIVTSPASWIRQVGFVEMSGVRARQPRVSFVTRGSETADGLYEFETKVADKGKAMGSSSNVQTLVLARRAETTVFGKYLILPAGSRIFVKTIEKRKPPKDKTLRFNTPQWEATYQNVAWQHGLAPRVYGYDNKSRVITMAPLVKTLESLFQGNDRKFSEEMQWKYVELAHRLDNIGIVHGDLVPANIMLDAFNNMFVIDFETARQITETELQNTGGHANLLSCMEFAGDSFQNITSYMTRINFTNQENDVITPLLRKVGENPRYNVEASIARGRNMAQFLQDMQPKSRSGSSIRSLMTI